MVLWFEHDLLDQLQIVQLLDWFAETKRRPAKLTMVCIDRFHGILGFSGLGQLNERQMASLYPIRKPVSDAQLTTAIKAWQAFREPDPRALEAFIHTDDDALPFLKKALKQHLEEFPWLSDGLSRTWRQILQLIAGGVRKPARVVMDNMDFEDCLYIGDWSTYGHIGAMCNGDSPLIRCEPDGRFRYPPGQPISLEKFKAQRLSLTAMGEDLLSGRAHGFDFLQWDCWLGGVHLKSLDWAWDADNRCMVEL